MIKFEQTSDGFKLYFKDYLFFNHSFKNPCFKIGAGSGRFKMRRGDFKIKEKIINKIPLLNYEIISQSEKKIELKLNSSAYQLKISFKIVNDHLEIVPECSDININRFWVLISAKANEAIYGCGEQFSELNLRGKNLPLWVQEQGIGRGDPPITGDWYTTYYPQPTFVSSENYYCHIETLSYSEFNFIEENLHELYIWNIPKKILIGKYNTALEVIINLSEYLGRQPVLPDWIFDGVWLGIQGGTEIVKQKIDRALSKGVKISGVWCQDWQGIRMTSFGKQLFWNWKYEEELYSELPAFIKSLNEKGIKFLGYINPFLALEGELYEEASKKDYLVKNKNGKDYYIYTTTFPAAILDLTNPETIEWIKSVIKKNMIDIGLSGFMADYGEYLPTDAILHSGESAEEFHNQYPVVWSKTVLDAVIEANKIGEVVFFTRSGYSHASKYTTLVFSGDQLVNWSIDDGLASVIPAGISLGICGIGYFHSDIGGFTTLDQFKRDKEVFMRWTELATFTMVMCTHEGSRPYDNWQFDSDDECLEHFGKMSRVYVHLKPYLKDLSKEYTENGIPPIRACYLHYENDPILHKIKYQYLFGKDLLVAPVIKPKQTEWKVYFPNDIWIHIWSGKKYTKGWQIVKAPLGEPPVFYRKKSKFSDLFRPLKNI